MARILSYAEYRQRRHEAPYRVEVTGSGRCLVVIGVCHSTIPDDPMFEAIEEAFEGLGPGLALHEGTPPAVEAEREVAIRRHGESGLVRHLAARSRIPTASLDIPLPVEARWLRDRLPAELTLAFLVVRQLASFNRKTARMDFEGYFRDFFELIAPGLGLDSLGWKEADAACQQVFGGIPEARRVDAVWTDPMREELPTQRVARLSNRHRDLHMLRALRQAAERFPRVFATVGVTHAVMLEPALRELYDGRNSPDDPTGRE